MKACVLVSGDFTTWGGMDRANYELASYLAQEERIPVHLVGYSVAKPLSDRPNVIWYQVPKPLDMYLLAEPLLAREGRRVAQRLAGQGARVVVNGGNCAWPDVNWIHAVHAAWDTRHTHAPALFRARAVWQKDRARRSERRAVRMARMILTNSEQARQQLIERIGVPPERVHTVYYGIDPLTFRPATLAEKREARERLGWPQSQPVVVFIGALGHDRNKGFDVLFDAWRSLCEDAAWDVHLVALGGGAEVEMWRNRSSGGLENRVRLLGFSNRVSEVLAAANALVSPTHYDAYGLGVHEALCCGLPAFVTRSAGVAERYPSDLTDLLLSDPPISADLAERLRHWRSNMESYNDRVSRFSETLRQRTWADMSGEISGLLFRGVDSL